ncbi:MAG: hypothetical protein Kow0089_20000 [Desulfobulbaceae bacterium]
MTQTLSFQHAKKTIGCAAVMLPAVLAVWISSCLAATYAERQLSAIARSRPGIEEVLRQGEGVRRFLLDAFSGMYTSVPLAWDASEPNDNAYAEHKPSVNRKVINIRVSSLLTPPDQVACMVYEAINAQNEKQFTMLTEQAHEGLLTKTEFIHRILMLEHKSLKRTRAFLSRQEPYRSMDISTTVFYRKMMGTPDGFDNFLEYLKEIKRKEYDVYKHYSDFYDFIIPPTKRWKVERNAAAGTRESGKSGDQDEKNSVEKVE